MRRSERNRGQERQLPGERAVSTAGPYPATGSVPMGTAQRRRWGGQVGNPEDSPAQADTR